MAPANEHGPRLTDHEYDRAIIELHRDVAAMPSRDEARALRRRELDLAIDHRLGRGFPADRRDALWAASERVESKRIWLGLKYILGSFIGARARHASALTHALAREYRQVLSDEELEQFLGPGPLALPVDRADCPPG